MANTSSSSSSLQASVYLVEHVSETYVQPLLLGVGIFTNVACLLLLLAERREGSRTDPEVGRCLVWLALSDLCVTICGFTHIVLEAWVLGGEVQFGYWSTVGLVNYIFYFCYLMFLGNSALIVVVIAMLRCVLIAQPLKARMWVTETKVKVILSVGFAVTLLLFTPNSLTVVWQLCFNETEVSGCVEALKDMPHLEAGSGTYLYILGVLYIPVPVLIYVICFIIIQVSLQRSRRSLDRHSEASRLHHRQRLRLSHRVTRLLLCILVVDTLCTVPTVASSIGLLISKDVLYDKSRNPGFHIFDSLGEIMLLIRPTYNFWLYLLVYRAFRRRLLMMAPHCCVRTFSVFKQTDSTKSHIYMMPKSNLSLEEKKSVGETT